MALKEFELIQQHFNKASRSELVDVAVGDDAAVFHLPVGVQCVTSVDVSVAGVHFPETTDPEAIGWKSLAVSISDMAAMGVEPYAALLALTLPVSDKAWLQAFARGFFDCAQQYGVDLIGGDTTRGALAISTTVFGSVPQGQALLRSNARPGDDIFVTGTFGAAGLALKKIQSGEAIEQALADTLNRPHPQIEIGQQIRGLASSAIDVSDGLLADLNHIVQQSSVGAVVQLANIPVSEHLSELSQQEQWQYALIAGDDYQLCFCAPRDQRDAILSLSTSITRIGHVRALPGMLLQDEQGKEIQLNGLGFEHFSE